VALEAASPDVRVLAEGFLAEQSAMDLLAVGSEGELISIRFAEAGDDAAGLTRALADLSWLRSRRTDLLKLAPGLGIEPSAEPRAALFCREIGSETRAAADNFPADTVELWGCRGLHRAGHSSLLLEGVSHGPATPDLLAVAPGQDASPGETIAGEGLGLAVSRSARSDAPGTDRPRPRSPHRPTTTSRSLTAPPSPSAFRTGLVDADLDPGASGESAQPSDSTSLHHRRPAI
jgi:hypothetical protein